MNGTAPHMDAAVFLTQEIETEAPVTRATRVFGDNSPALCAIAHCALISGGCGDHCSQK